MLSVLGQSSSRLGAASAQVPNRHESGKGFAQAAASEGLRTPYTGPLEDADRSRGLARRVTAVGQDPHAEVEAVAAGAAGRLGLHEGLSQGFAAGVSRAGAERGRDRCVCGPKTLRLLSEHGEVVPVRGKAVNRCKYCAKLAAIENAEMLWLDALEGDAPQVWMVLGTRTATVDMAGFYEGLRRVKLAIRAEPARAVGPVPEFGEPDRDGRKLVRRWPDAEYACCLEFTTGYGPRSGGKRRPHWNLLWKGVSAGDAADLLRVAAAAWVRHVDAEIPAQNAQAVYAAGGLMRYLALHFCKETQTPPAAFRGQRFNCSRGYFTGCTRATARARARSSLAYKREVWKLTRSHGPFWTATEIEAQAHVNFANAVRTRWTLANERGARLGRQSVVGDPTHWRLFLKLRTPAGERVRWQDRDEASRRRFLVTALRSCGASWSEACRGDRRPPAGGGHALGPIVQGVAEHAAPATAAYPRIRFYHHQTPNPTEDPDDGHDHDPHAAERAAKLAKLLADPGDR